MPGGPRLSDGTPRAKKLVLISTFQHRLRSSAIQDMSGAALWCGVFCCAEDIGYAGEQQEES